MADKIKDDFDKALDAIGVWLMKIKDYPGFHEWKIKEIGNTLSYGDLWSKASEEHPTTFIFPPHIEKQHDAITAFLDLATTWQALVDTQFYFRRYPFQNMPISLDTHLRYICETYFSRVYQFSERLKKCLNALNEVIPNKTDAGAMIKLFGKDFRDEIRERNLIHHHVGFDELMIKRIRLEGLMASDKGDNPGDRGWKAEQRRTYRKASKEWTNRVIQRSTRARVYLNAVSYVVAERCTFLTDPITLDPS